MLSKKKKVEEMCFEGIMQQWSVDNKQLCARALVHEDSDNMDESQIDKYRVEKVLPATLYAAAAAKNLPEKSQSRAERNG